MKVAISFICILFLLASSCTKSSNSNSKSSSIDSTYLPKTELSYFYDSTGTTVTDSATASWTYDSQRRLLTYYWKRGSLLDTTVYTYSSTQSTYYFSSTYLPNISSVNYTFYLSPQGQPDSSIATHFNTPPASTYITYSYYDYDASGNDTAIQSYLWMNDQKLFSGRVVNTYSNNVLTSSTSFLPDNSKTSTYLYSGGNILSDTVYLTGATLLSETYTYTTTPSGGFYGQGAFHAQLIDSYTQTNYQTPASSYYNKYGYTFDTYNRVSTATLKNAAGIIVEKDTYTYY